jgi:hypothetical protein
MDVGSSVIDDLHWKNWYMQIGLGDVVNTIASLRNTELNLMYYGLGLDESTDNIASDVLSTLTLVGEFPQALELLPENQPKNYVHVVEEAIGLDAIENVLMLSQRQLKGLECISTQDLSLIRLQSNFEAYSLKCFTSQTPLSPDDILYTMHSINPSPPIELRLGSSK